MGRSSKDGSEPKPRHPLILDGLCLHVLSSFQRTGAVRLHRTSPEVLSGVCLPGKIPSEGEPYKFTITVNPLSTLDGHRFARLDRSRSVGPKLANCLQAGAGDPFGLPPVTLRTF